MTRGLIRGNPSVPVQGTAEELKQVLLTCDLLIVLVQFFFYIFTVFFHTCFTSPIHIILQVPCSINMALGGMFFLLFFYYLFLFIYSLCHIYLFICYKNVFLFFLVAFFYIQLQIWKKYIAWEKSNPLRTEDTALLTKRGILFTLHIFFPALYVYVLTHAKLPNCVVI